MMHRTLGVRRACGFAAAGLVCWALAPAAFGQLSGVQSVTVEQNIQNAFHIAEVQAFESGTGTNVASQSNGGVASANGSSFGTEPGDANDGNTDGSFGNGSVWHSGPTNDGPFQADDFLRVDFSSPRTIETLTIFGRTDCCTERDDNLDVILRGAGGEEPFRFDNVALGGANNSLTLAVPVPEPVVLGLVGLGGLGLLARRPRRR